jgi:hypothetical protein
MNIENRSDASFNSPFPKCLFVRRIFQSSQDPRISHKGGGGTDRGRMSPPRFVPRMQLALLLSCGLDTVAPSGPTFPESCSLAMALVLSPVCTAVTWQGVYMSQYFKLILAGKEVFWLAVSVCKLGALLVGQLT